MAAKMFKRKITVDLYSRIANLYVVKKIEDMQSYLDKKTLGMLDVMDSEGCVFDLFSEKNGLEYYIVLVESKISHNLIAHEVYHLATKMAHDIEIKDEESVAWIIGFLTETIYKILKSKNYIIADA
jgi:hypothetical protein